MIIAVVDAGTNLRAFARMSGTFATPHVLGPICSTKDSCPHCADNPV